MAHGSLRLQWPAWNALLGFATLLTNVIFDPVRPRVCIALRENGSQVSNGIPDSADDTPSVCDWQRSC